ncbi:2-oxo-4-hydroxy-4-carboxy-5-ureidoimidazoline decarboxylase [Streptomyces brevispora]|uniref:2-oxo-4-hydroxy-4-carboxy-5-ureidoimidazoline decarboxylase n=1 Tax=Streptomyces brevispora TaxID=887462 RepID=UPI0033DBB61E
MPLQSHGPVPGRAGPPGLGLHRLNTAPAVDVEAALLDCFGSRRWAQRLAAHRPYPDLGALLAAAEEADYDLSPADRAEALVAEDSPALPADAARSAHLALAAAHAAYESRFGHVFVICLDGVRPVERPDQVLAGIRARLGHDPDQERVVTADELRRLARGRIIGLVSSQ